MYIVLAIPSNLEMPGRLWKVVHGLLVEDTLFYRGSVNVFMVFSSRQSWSQALRDTERLLPNFHSSRKGTFSYTPLVYSSVFLIYSLSILLSIFF